jgi:chromosome partitioning protein
MGAAARRICLLPGNGVPMRSIAIINQKGGVGKTTTAVNVSAAVAATGQRVCLIDLDPQAHATLHLGIEPQRHGPSVYNVLTGQASLADVRKQISENLWVCGSHIDLAAVEVELAGVVGRELILRDKLAEETDEFDYLFIDCPPSLGILTLNALSAVEEVFIPLQPHFLALHGLSKLLATIDLVSRRLNPKLQLSGVVMCMFESGTRLAAEVGRDVEEFFDQGRGQRTPWAGAQTFQTRIRRNIRLAEAPSFGQSIFQYAPTSNGAEDYRRLAGEILKSIDEEGSGASEEGLGASLSSTETPATSH